MPRGSAISYGKISLASEGESVEKLVEVLDGLMEKHGYPERKKEEEDDEDELEKDEQKLKEMMQSTNEEELV